MAKKLKFNIKEIELIKTYNPGQIHPQSVAEDNKTRDKLNEIIKWLRKEFKGDE